MKPRMRPRKPASIGSNQASPANSPSGLAAVVLSLSMAWSPPARQRRALVVESQPETTSPHFQPHPGRDRDRAVQLGASDPPTAMLTSDQAAFAIDGIAVRIHRRLTEDVAVIVVF